MRIYLYIDIVARYCKQPSQVVSSLRTSWICTYAEASTKWIHDKADTVAVPCRNIQLSSAYLPHPSIALGREGADEILKARGR